MSTLILVSFIVLAACAVMLVVKGNNEIKALSKKLNSREPVNLEHTRTKEVSW